MDPNLVSKVKADVQGKRYSDLTPIEWEVLFGDDQNAITTVCLHNKIIDDSGAMVNESGTSHRPVFKNFDPEPEPEVTPTVPPGFESEVADF